MKWVKKVGISLTALALVVVAPTAAAAQSYGDALPLVTQIATGSADAEGQFQYRYTAPDLIEEDFLVYVVGTDEDGEPFEWVVAAVTPAFAGLTWTLAGANMEPGSDFVLEARSAGVDESDDADDEDADDTSEADDPAADGGDDADQSTSEAATGNDGNGDNDGGDNEDAAASASSGDDQDVRGVVGMALVLVVIAAALIYGIRLSNGRRRA